MTLLITDIIADNGKEVVIVEVKTTLDVQDVDDFKDKLDIFPYWRQDYLSKKIYGAVAYLKSVQSSKKYAEKKGLFVIRATGSSASIINNDNFTPKNFALRQP